MGAGAHLMRHRHYANLDFLPPPPPPPPAPEGIFAAWPGWNFDVRGGGTMNASAQTYYQHVKNFYNANVETLGIGYGGNLLGTGKPNTSTGTNGLFNGRIRADGLRDPDEYHIGRYGQNLIRTLFRLSLKIPDPWVQFAIARWSEPMQDAWRQGWRNTTSSLPPVPESPYLCLANYDGGQAERTGTDWNWLNECKMWELMERSIYAFGHNLDLEPPAGWEHYYGGALPSDFIQQTRNRWIYLLEEHLIPKWYGVRSWEGYDLWKGYERLTGGFVRAMQVGEPIVMRNISHTLFSAVMACHYRFLNTGLQIWEDTAKLLYDHWHEISIKPVNTSYGDGYAIKRGNTSNSNYGLPTVYMPTVFGLWAECVEIGFYPEKINDDLLVKVNRALTEYWITGTDANTTARGATGNSAIVDANGEAIAPAPLEYYNGRELYPGYTHDRCVKDEFVALLPWDEVGTITSKFDAAAPSVGLDNYIFYPALKVLQEVA